MDPGFTLEKPTRTALEERVRVIATRAFWDVVREEFAKSKFDNMVPGVLNDIRQQLLSIVSESGKIAQEIRAKLDIPFLVQQLEHKILNIRSTYLYITDKMSQLCAPVRDASIRELHNTLASDSTSIDYALISQRILDILEDMKLDLSNYRLQTLRPHLAEIAVAYEKSKFAEAREKGVVGIERTKEWISASVETLKGTLAQRNPENIELSDRVRYEVAYHEAVLSLVLPAGVVEEVTKENVPETMILDVERIKKYRAEGVKLATIAAVVTLARNSSAVMRDPLRTRGLRDTLIVLLEDSESSPSHISAAVVDAIEKAGGKVAEPELLKGMVERCVRGDSVFAVVMRRVAGVVRGHLATGVFRGGERELARVGLEMVGRELEALSLRVFTLAKHNARVHAELYDEILSDLV
ncbi:T-complex 11 [Cladochytrium replicatum]|nr:T-complex 11 [Cladochytrium replicatum]